jgi:MYXO-CTERM domain-containing protein
MSRLASAAIAIAIAFASASSAHAYVRESSNWNPSTLPISYYINQSTIPSSLGTSTGITAVDNGFATWATPTCTSWRATDAGNTSASANTGDRRNVIMWLTAWPAEYGSSTIGVTTPVWSSGGYFIDADIVFNAYNFTWNTTGTGGGGSNVDAQSIATHEEGHFLGLDHTPTSSAIMYASYSGGLKRTLQADDQNGVCAIYPSGVAASDAGPRPDAGGGSSSDPCAVHAPGCGDCTPYAGCGFCAETGLCVSGTRTGPTGSSCGAWAWYESDCASVGTPDAGTVMPPVDAGSASGGGRFGDPCTQPTDCATGGLCAVDTSGTGFCTRACADDCGCPDSYSCYAVSSTISVCVPGTNTCSMGGTDAGTVLPGDDAAVLPGDDAGMVIMPGDDAGDITSSDDGGTTTHRTRGGCACSAAGTPANGSTGASLLGLIALGAVIARRRRPR